MPQAIELKLSDFCKTYVTCHTISLHSERLPWQQNYKKYIAEFSSIDLKFLKNSVIYEDIGLKFDMELNFGVLNSLTLTSSTFWAIFADENTNMTSL